MLLVYGAYNAMLVDFAADPDWLAHLTAGVTDVGIIPITAPFAPSRDLTLGSLSFPDPAALDPGGAILGADENSNIVTDGNGNRGIRMNEPLGGFTWTLIDDSAPVDIYGFALVRAAVGVPTVLYGVAQLGVPVRLSINGQSIQASSIIGFLAGDIFEGITSAISTGGPIPV